MPLFDASRYLFSLAGALANGEWNATGLRTSFAQAAGDRRIRVPGLFSRLLTHFPASPGYGPLLAFLVADVGVMRALKRLEEGSWTPSLPARRQAMGSPPPRLGTLAVPRLATSTALAAWLEIEPRRLLWYADITGRNRKHPP
ncbi:MAG TPA: hypothetical protein VLM40_10605, partial [Gemmata sp.]|nr:hypothetical protein [Gemmata sp.]